MRASRRAPSRAPFFPISPVARAARSPALRVLRLLVAILRYRDVAYARRLLGRAGQNLRLVLGQLGAHYVRIRPCEDFGGVPAGTACERYVLGSQPAGLVRVNLAAYQLALDDVADRVAVGTPRWAELDGPEPPEYLWVRASRPRPAASQEEPSARR